MLNEYCISLVSRFISSFHLGLNNVCKIIRKVMFVCVVIVTAVVCKYTCCSGAVYLWI